MKKRLESELISIAHRILKLKNKSEVDQLYHEAQKLYETLATLKFYQDNFEQLKSSISQEELEAKLIIPVENGSEVIITENEKEFPKKTSEIRELTSENIENSEKKPEDLQLIEEKEIVINENKTEDFKVIQNVVEETIGEKPWFEAKPDLDFEPIFELAAETPDEQPEEKVEKQIDSKKGAPQQISFEDLLGQNYSEPIFVKPNDISNANSKVKIEEETTILSEKIEHLSPTLNDKLINGINVGLNDRIGFVKNLFSDSTEDYNRVISQLNTFDSLQEAQEFIEDMVKPDYNNWKGKEEYAERFMEIVEKKFA